MPDVRRFSLENGKAICLLGEANPVNLGAVTAIPSKSWTWAWPCNPDPGIPRRQRPDIAGGPATCSGEIQNEVAVRTLRAWT